MKQRTSNSRRQFLQTMLATASAPWIIPRHVLGGPNQVGANDRIEMGLIGVGMRGKYLLANLPQAVRVTALCDMSLSQINSARNPTGRFSEILKPFATTDGSACKIYQDYRKLLANQRLDAVMIAAPDHHHAQAAILACQAGCDVYVEKPLSVTIAEGRAIVDAAEKSQRVVQVGSQQRSMLVNRRACEFIRAGGLGKIHYVEERNYPGPMPYQPEDFPEERVPHDLQWDLFCGPTPRRSYNHNLWMKDDYKLGYLLWRGWDLIQDYSGHLMTNWGAHSLDMVHYALGMDRTGPVKIEPHLEEVDLFTDDMWHDKTPPIGSVADKHFDRTRFSPVTLTYANGVEVRLRPDVRKTTFYGENGRLILGRNDYKVEPEELLAPPEVEEQKLWDGEGHVARPHIENWIEAIRSRSVPNAPIEIGHRTATVCHLVNLARQLNRTLHWNPETERFVEDRGANAFLTRPRRSGFEFPDDSLSLRF